MLSLQDCSRTIRETANAALKGARWCKHQGQGWTRQDTGSALQASASLVGIFFALWASKYTPAGAWALFCGAGDTLIAHIPWLPDAWVSFKAVLWAAPPPDAEQQAVWLGIWGTVICVSGRLLRAIKQALTDDPHAADRIDTQVSTT